MSGLNHQSLPGSRLPGGSATASYKPLSMWVLYDHPRDLPEVYVARRWEMQDKEMRATGVTLQGSDLEELRQQMRARGLFCLKRDLRDDPVIVEVWL